MGYKIQIPTVTILDEGYVLALFVDYGYGDGPQFSASYPTGIQAAYQEARDRQRAVAERLANERKAEILAPYATLGE